MPDLIPGDLTPNEAQALRDNINTLVGQALARGKRFTVGTLVGNVRTKQYPDNPIQGEQVRIVFVVDVRLREYTGQPIARDVLVTNQAHQLITGRQSEGMPVTLSIGTGGILTVTGRAALKTEETAVNYYQLDDIDGEDLAYANGLRVRNTAALEPSLLSAINTWRAQQGLAAMTADQDYFYDPAGDVLGEDYYAAYIAKVDGGRFPGGGLGLTCTYVQTPYSWDEDDFWGVPTGFQVHGWSAVTEELECS